MSGATEPVAGRFALGDLLGAGGSASVFAAVDARTGERVALKVLHPHLAGRAVAREAFLAEARRAAPLRHPHIVGVIDVGVDGAPDAPTVWIALELAPGASLAEHVARHGPLSPAEAAAVGDGVLRALEAAHAIGLIHRDVSPANVMVASGTAGAVDVDGVRLLDFGLADAAGRAALGTDDLLSAEAVGRAGVMGNVNYMSPEHVRGLPVDERGDVYQVGAMLHFALTGRPPFPRDTTGQTMRAHLETPPTPPSVSDSRIPRAFDRVVVRAMLKDPADRFPSAAAMRAAVAALAPGPVPVAERASPPVATSSPPGVERARNERDETSRTPAPAASAIPSVTRVLGRTVIPPRAPAPAPASASVARPRPGRARSRAGTWLTATAAAAVIAAVVVFAAMSEPTASADPEPSAAPPPAPVAASPAPEPAPTVVSATTVAVPGLARLSVGEAAAALAAVGLDVGEVTLADSPHPADTVLSSSPAAGRRLRAGSPVALTAATGANAIPDVAGLARADATGAVQAAGFVPAFATLSAPAGVAPGAIVGTTPAAGDRLSVGDTVMILEADPDDRWPTPTPTPTPMRPTPTPTPTSEPETD